MPVNIEDRPLKKIREEVIDQLVMNYGHDEITLEAFEKRLDIVFETEDRSVLLEQVADLELKTDNQYQKTKADRLSKDKNYFGGVSDEPEKIFKLLSSSVQNGPWVVGKEISVTNILSDFTLDFTDAIFSHPVVHVRMFSLFTSDTIYVPEGVRVVCKTSAYLSAIQSTVSNGAEENSQTIIIHGNSILSSLEIKIRVTLKEKWLNFADGVKKLLG